MPAHKVVLASVSPYFHAMFNDDLAEKLQGEVTIQDIDATALQTLVEYSYTGNEYFFFFLKTHARAFKKKTRA